MNKRYLMLMLPSANRVYNAAATDLARAELQCFNACTLQGKIADIEPIEIAGVSYLGFSSERLTPQDVRYLSNFSFLYALFETCDQSLEAQCSPLLKPVPLSPLSLYDDDLISILKFAGKTNEQFTRMLVNVTLMATALTPHRMDRKLDVLDPLCGRGTTLNQALMYGFNASGIELERRDFDAYSQFINRWLKDKRLKHKSVATELRSHGKTQAHRLNIRLAPTKQDYKAGNLQVLDVVLADTVRAAEFYKRDSFDLIVTDLPYGVKHDNHLGKGQSRSPIALLEEAVPVWKSLLRRGGAIGLAWNTHLAKKDEMIRVLEASGLRIFAATSDNRFRHRVDQGILRDIVIAQHH